MCLLNELDAVAFLRPWELVGVGLEKQLAKELPPTHELYGVTAYSVARRFDNDDVLFVLPGNAQPYAVVHLTWSTRVDPSGQWPATTLYESLDDWITRCMKPDNGDRIRDEIE